MKINGMVQAVILMLLLASAASCEVSQSYFKKVFPAKTNHFSSIQSAKFLKTDSISANDKIEIKKTTISTDSINNIPQNDLQKSERIRTKKIRQTTLN